MKMDIKKILFTPITLFFLTCTISLCFKVPIEKRDNPGPISMIIIDSLFEPYITDMSKAVKIIKETNLIANLYHLMDMDNGGQTYYLLEYEQLNQLMESVTEKMYEDLIITNHLLQILFSMRHYEFCGKRLLNISPTLHHFLQLAGYSDISISNTFEYPTLSGTFSFAIVYPIQSENRNKGFLIGIINTNNIVKLLPPQSIIIDKQGKRIAPYSTQQSLINNTLHHNVYDNENPLTSITPLIYKNIEWYIISSHK